MQESSPHARQNLRCHLNPLEDANLPDIRAQPIQACGPRITPAAFRAHDPRQRFGDGLGESEAGNVDAAPGEGAEPVGVEDRGGAGRRRRRRRGWDWSSSKRCLSGRNVLFV